MRLVLRTLVLALVLAGCDRNTTVPEHASAAANAAEEVTPGESSGVQQTDRYLGAEACAGCHAAEYRAWKNSHHDLAMKEPAADTVRGDFDNTGFTYFGTQSTFFRRDGQYFVRTDGADGELQDFPVAYTFGTYPLQQYLIELPGGRLQALSISWDARPEGEGGQRWFHLYPDEEVKAGDPLHWTGLNQNWNFMCADCHSTNFQKNYSPDTKTFASTWSEINVGCEACHGPGAKHVDWAGLVEEQRAVKEDKGFAISFADRTEAVWAMDTESGIAHIQGGVQTQAEIAVCAQCHSRRSTSFPGARPHHPFLDHFNPSLLQAGLYHADGQIDDEVYVYGSFLQSKMHAAGVTCSNCHNPHTLEVRAEGNNLCAQCHLPDKFNTAEHHLHPDGSEGTQCVNCHMTDKVYMQVDARRDHSFRVPRPDLSISIGSPNACTGCHTEQPDTWAAQVLEEKFGKPDSHYGEALFAGRTGAPDAETQLMSLAMDESQPDIARATAVAMLPRYLSQASAQALQVIAQGNEALLHLGIAQSLEQLPERIRPALAIPLLYEDEKVTASLAASSIAGAPMGQFPEKVQMRQKRALQNHVASESFNADRPESLVNLAGLYLQQGDLARSERAFQDAIHLDPGFTPAYINLADLYRASGREREVAAVLRQGMAECEDKTSLQHALGLSLVRQQRLPEALHYLRESARSETTSPRYVYVYGVALNSSGEKDAAIRALEQGLLRFPGEPQLLQLLASLNREFAH
ncbi:tetratricopeptide repeat protein [Microbulbifer celer]|uniref:Tetratricopeptide repeat protein n=1 Tax=Microbulbifer celer TaxID=435905 RepID=A0ABW3UEF1_9GAMM|nr:multiheme c-type cytochrome [Microbulbifer celer]UFN55812.1 tetratricopeptide repeat protein [Microbulbifer celer]